MITPEEKARNKQRTNLRILHSQIKGDFSFKKITTWYDVHKRLGYPDSICNQYKDKSLTFAELKEFLQKQVDELEQKYDTTKHPNGSKQEPDVKEIRQSNDALLDTNVTRIQQPESIQPRTILPTPQVSTSSHPTVQQVVKDLEDDYGYTYSPNSEWFAYWFQKKAGVELRKKVFEEKKSGILLLSATGTGKTFIALDVIRHAFDINWHEGKTFSHIPYLYVTKSSILEQTGRVAEKHFKMKPNVDLEIINIEQLRSKDGQYWVKEEVEIKGGKEVVKWVWKKKIQPCIILLDESQGTKNKKAKQSQIFHSYNDLLDNVCLISVSATPFVRVSEAQSFAVSTHRPLEHLGFPKGTVLTNETWPAYAAIMASPGKPEDYNNAAIERLMKDLDDYVVRVRGVKPQFNAINGVKIIPFENEEKARFYHEAITRFEEEKKKIDNAKEMGDSAGICYLTILLKYAMAAELNHADGFADMMYEAVMNRGKAAVCAVKFKQTLIAIVRRLNEKYGVSRDDISLVWGGGQTKQTKKQKAKAKIKSLENKLKEMGVDLDEMLEDTGLEDVEDRIIVDLPAHLRLEMQDNNERQKEIDKFQSGKSLYCIYTLKSGGVGLSLHHTDELSTFKCRRKESGYAVEEDIPKVPIRPRETFVVVTYNAIELVQGVGRVPRLTSLSPTVQNVYCYAGTIEVDMGRIYSQKLRCLSSVVKQKEDWMGVIFGGSKRAQVVDEIINKTANAETDESTLIDEGEEDNDEENGDK